MSILGKLEEALFQRDVNCGQEVTSVLWKRALGLDVVVDDAEWGYLSRRACASERHWRSAMRTEQPLLRRRRAKARLIPEFVSWVVRVSQCGDGLPEPPPVMMACLPATERTIMNSYF